MVVVVAVLVLVLLVLVLVLVLLVEVLVVVVVVVAMVVVVVAMVVVVVAAAAVVSDGGREGRQRTTSGCACWQAYHGSTLCIGWCHTTRRRLTLLTIDRRARLDRLATGSANFSVFRHSSACSVDW